MDQQQQDFFKQLRELLEFIGNDVERFKGQKSNLDDYLIKGRTFTMCHKNKKPHLEGLTPAERHRAWYRANQESERAKNLERYYKRKARKQAEAAAKADNPTE